MGLCFSFNRTMGSGSRKFCNYHLYLPFFTHGIIYLNLCIFDTSCFYTQLS